MELRQLQYFITTYDERSVTNAAQRLNIVQPAISQQLARLEEEIGQQLFLRTPKGMVPTSAGEEAYELFQTVLKDVEFAKQSLAERKGIISGQVSLGVIYSVANNALSETLKSFTTEYPDVRIRATGGYTNELIEMLRSFEVDAVIINRPPNAREPNMTDIVTEEMALVCGSGNAHQPGKPVSIKDVATMDIVIPSKRHGLRSIIDQAAANAGVVLKPRHEFDELATIEDFIQSTDFFSILPPIAFHRAIRDGRIRHFPITPRISRRLVYMTNVNRPAPKSVTLLVEALKEKMIEFQRALEGTASA